MRAAGLSALLLAALGCTTALAQGPEARQRTYPTQDGFLEVDPRTGAITECKRARGSFRCHRVRENDPLLQEPSASDPPRLRERRVR
jgi:hypothetical protein